MQEVVMSQAKTLFHYVLPSICGQLCIFLFTIVDGIFVGRGVGEMALGAINIILPFIMALNALYMLTTVGGATVTAIRLGRGDTEGANLAFLHSLTALLVTAAVLTAVGVGLTEPLGYLLGANEAYISDVQDYLFWYSAFILPSALSMLLQFFVRNDGSPILVMAATGVSSGLNIFLDWLFVFPLRQGVAGAAIATGISQTVSFLILASHFFRKQGALRVRRFRLDAKLMKKVLMRGAPEAVAQFASPVSILCLNYVLLERIGAVAVNAFSVICYTASFSVAVFYGVSEGMQPLIGQAYGEKNTASLKFYFRASLAISLAGSLLVYGVLRVLDAPICLLFGVTGETLAYTVSEMPVYAFSFVFMALNTIISAYLYSTKRTQAAVTLNILRSFVFTTAAILLLPRIFGTGIVWYTAAIYEAASLLAAVALVWWTERNGIVYR